MNRYEEIENFVRIVESGSITAAAKQLRIAKSAVSRRLKELEARLGTQLIVRSTRKLVLTAHGHAFYERSKSLLLDWEEMEALMSEEQINLKGSLRISAPEVFGILHLGGVLLDFMDKQPGILIDIEYTERKVDLISEGIDLAIRIGALTDSTLIARKLADISTVVLASPALLKDMGRPETPEDLYKFKQCAYGNNNSLAWQYRLPDVAKGQIELEPSLIATNGTFLCEAAMANKGLIKLPRFIAYHYIQSGELVEILPDWQWAELALYAVYSPTRHLSPRIRMFVDHLIESFNGMPYWETEL